MVPPHPRTDFNLVLNVRIISQQIKYKTNQTIPPDSNTRKPTLLYHTIVQCQAHSLTFFILSNNKLYLVIVSRRGIIPPIVGVRAPPANPPSEGWPRVH